MIECTKNGSPVQNGKRNLSNPSGWIRPASQHEQAGLHVYKGPGRPSFLVPKNGSPMPGQSAWRIAMIECPGVLE